MYISEEDVGICRYDLAAPTGLVPPRFAFASAGPLLAPDVEGLALAGGVLYASGQNVAAPRFNWYVSDDCDQTDGIDACAGNLGPAFPDGLFVCQDGFNDAPGSSGTQNFKYASLSLVDGSP